MNNKGILWLTLENQVSPVKKLYNPAKHLHVTIKFDVTIDSVKQYLGKNVYVELTENCWNKEIQAVRVKLPSSWASMCNNKDPHMTISHKSDVKPFKSNAMLEGAYESEILKNRNIKLIARFFMFGVGEIEDVDAALKGYSEK